MRTTIGVFILMVATALAHDSGRKDSYVFRDGDVTWMLGEGMSSDSLKKMQSTLGREFLWARRKGRTFVSHDSGIIDQARAVVQRNIGRDEQEARLAEITDRAMRRSYVLTTDGGVSFSSGVDFKNIKYLRKQYNDSFLWVRTDGHSWLIQDPEWIDRATVFFADAMALAPEQRAVASEEAELDREEERLEKLHDHARPREVNRRQQEVGRREAELDEREDALEREAEGKLWALIDDAIRRGVARPLR